MIGNRGGPAFGAQKPTPTPGFRRPSEKWPRPRGAFRLMSSGNFDSSGIDRQRQQHHPCLRKGPTAEVLETKATPSHPRIFPMPTNSARQYG